MKLLMGLIILIVGVVLAWVIPLALHHVIEDGVLVSLMSLLLGVAVGFVVGHLIIYLIVR